MRFALVSPGDLSAGDLAAWRDLASRAVQPNPLFEPECLVPAVRSLAGREELLLAVAEEGGRWYACIPLCPAPAWRRLRRPVLTSAVRRMIYDGTPLVDAERSVESLTSLLRGLRAAARGDRPGLVVLDWVDDGPAAADLQRASRSAGTVYRAYEVWERPMVLRRDQSDYRAGHSRKFLYNTRRLRRRLAADEGGEVRLTDRSATADAVQLLLAMESGGYKGENGVAVATVRGEPEWFAAMCDSFRAEGRLHLYTLDAGPRAVAAQLLVRGQQGLFLLKTVYDEAFAAYSPGVQLHLDVIDHVHGATDAEWIDTCTYAGNETLLRLYPDRHSVASLVVATGGVADRSALWAVTAARSALGRTRRTSGRITGSAASSAAPSGRRAVAAVATAVR